MTRKLPIVVLISGAGSNLQAIIHAIAQGLPVHIDAVISNKADAYGLVRAQQAQIPTHIIEHNHFSDRQTFEKALIHTIESYQPRLIVLAGFMRQLTPHFVQYYWGRLINIHPSLLPKYPGLHTHRKALAAKDHYHGASVHFVTDQVDLGPVICQAKLTILPDDDEHSLKKRVLALEHRLYLQVLAWIAAGKIKLTEDGVWLDNRLLPAEGVAFT